MQYVMGPIKGDEQLWVVLWIYYAFINLLILGISYYMDVNHLVLPLAAFTAPVLTVLSYVYDVWVNVALWQCAFNGSSRLTGHVIRLGVVITFCFMLYSAISTLTEPRKPEGAAEVNDEALTRDAIKEMEQLQELLRRVQNP